MDSPFDDKSLLSDFSVVLREQMLKAAEPIIQKALADVEKEMRQRLAEMIVGTIRHSYSAERFGTDLRITVAMGAKRG